MILDIYRCFSLWILRASRWFLLRSQCRVPCSPGKSLTNLASDEDFRVLMFLRSKDDMDLFDYNVQERVNDFVAAAYEQVCLSSFQLL